MNIKFLKTGAIFGAGMATGAAMLYYSHKLKAMKKLNQNSNTNEMILNTLPLIHNADNSHEALCQYFNVLTDNTLSVEEHTEALEEVKDFVVDIATEEYEELKKERSGRKNESKFDSSGDENSSSSNRKDKPKKGEDKKGGTISSDESSEKKKKEDPLDAANRNETLKLAKMLAFKYASKGDRKILIDQLEQVINNNWSNINLIFEMNNLLYNYDLQRINDIIDEYGDEKGGKSESITENEEEVNVYAEDD